MVSTDRTYPLLDIKKNNKMLSIGIKAGHCNVRAVTSQRQKDASDYCRACGGKKDHVKMRKIILYAADFLWLCENNPSLEIQ